MKAQARDDPARPRCTICVHVLTVLLVSSFLLATPQPRDCADAASCRQAALDAAAGKDFEAFHDLAWRVVQKGKRNDPDSMLLLARAQSLSGRPGDALVMLRRLAELGHAGDALDGEDFGRVRALPGWPDVEGLLTAARDKRPASPPVAARRADAPAKEPVVPGAAKGDLAKAPPATPTPLPPRTDATAAPSGSASATAPKGVFRGEEAIRLTGSSLDAVGLAYDSVSRRFVVGDRRLNRLIVADLIYKHINDLIGPGSGGFGTLTALEIDGRRGDLWVTSAGDEGKAAIHKLQLVSGRVLGRVDVADDSLPAKLTDIAMSDGGAVLLLDAIGSRLLTLSSSGQGFSRVIPLGVPAPSSIAAAGTSVYVTHDDGLSAIDLKSGTVSVVKGGKGVQLTGLRRIRWHRGALVAILDDGKDKGARLVRIRLGRSPSVASRVDVLDDAEAEAGSILTIAGGDAYYLARAAGGPVIRRVPLQ